MRRTSSAIVLMASLLVAACSGSGGGTAAPGATTASEAPGASSPAASGESPGASTSAGTGFDAQSVSGDLTLQGWSAGAVEAPILQKVLEDFQAKYPNIKVKFEPISGNYVDAMAPKFSSQDVPDVFYVDSSQAATWIDDGVLEPLDDYVSKSGFDTSKFYPGYLDAFKGPDGKLYGLPKDGNTLAMAYNTDLLQKAGVTTPPTDWASLTDAVTKLKSSGVDTPLCLGPSLDRALAFIYAGGGSLYNADMTAAAIDSPESVAGHQRVPGLLQGRERQGAQGPRRRLVWQVAGRAARRDHLRGWLARPVHEGELRRREVPVGRDARRTRRQGHPRLHRRLLDGRRLQEQGRVLGAHQLPDGPRGHEHLDRGWRGQSVPQRPAGR